MTIEYRDRYFDDPDAKASFERYAKTIFGLDFGLWKERGLWDDRYLPFSAFVGGECVASICVYPLAMSVGGAPKTGAQLLTVGTLPKYRGQGIQRELWDRAHRWIRQECGFTFLFTDDSAAGLYESLGLRRQSEFTEIIPRPRPVQSAPARFLRLDLDRANDYSVIERLAREREMVSGRLGFDNPNLLLFMVLYAYPSQLYYLEEIDTVVVAEEAPDRLRIHDIVAREMPELSDVEAFLSHFHKDEIEFLFCTDRLGVERPKTEMVMDSVLFVSDGFDLAGEYVFPFSIRA